MPEPITAPLEQAPTGTPQQTQQEPVQTGNQPVQKPEVTPTEGPTAEQIAQWRSAAEQSTQLAERVRQQDEQFRSLQADYTRKAQALAQLAGANPQPPVPEPWRLYADELIKEKVNPQEAEIFAKSHYRMVQQTMAPLQQELAGYRNAHSIEPAVKTELDRIYTANPQLFAQPGTYEKALQDTMTAVQQGMNVDATFVRQMTVLAADALGQVKPPQANPAQPMPQIFANGVTRPTPGYHPAQPLQNQPQLTADQQKADAFIREQFKIPTT